MTPMPHPPYLPDLADLAPIFFICLVEEVLKWKHFADVEEVKQTNKPKNSRSTERHQNSQAQNCFEQWYINKWRVVLR